MDAEYWRSTNDVLYSKFLIHKKPFPENQIARAARLHWSLLVAYQLDYLDRKDVGSQGSLFLLKGCIFFFLCSTLFFPLTLCINDIQPRRLDWISKVKSNLSWFTCLVPRFASATLRCRQSWCRLHDFNKLRLVKEVGIKCRVGRRIWGN